MTLNGINLIFQHRKDIFRPICVFGSQGFNIESCRFLFFFVQTTRDVYLNCFIYLEYIICKILSINLISWRWNGYNIRNVHTSFFWGHKVHTSRNIIKLFYMPMIYFLYCYFRFHFLVHNVLALTVADSLFVWFIQPYTNN